MHVNEDVNFRLILNSGPDQIVLMLLIGDTGFEVEACSLLSPGTVHLLGVY